jgi:hypothetical protein
MKRIFLLSLALSSMFVSKAQWSVIGSTTNISNTNTGNVGIGVGSASPTAKLEVLGPTLGSASGNKASLFRIQNGLGSNASLLDVLSVRHTAGNDWQSATTRIQQTIDGTAMGYIDFNPQSTYLNWGIGLGTNGETRMLINSLGNVGIGTTSPDQKLHVSGGFLKVSATASTAYAMQGFTNGGANDNIGIALHDGATAASPYLWIAKSGSSWGGPTDKMVIASSKNAGATKDLWIFANDNLAPSVPNILIQANTGGVSIGTAAAPAGYKLAVGGNIIAEKVKVQLQPWADFVFEPSYKLPTLKEVEAFIQSNKHLPGVPSAKEVEKNGLDLGNNQAVLLQKIEELTLYLLEQDKQQAALRKELKEQNDRMNELTHQIELLKKNQ